MRIALIPVSILALAACDMAIPDFRGGGTGAAAPAAAPVVPATPISAKDRFVAAAEANGCVLNAGNVATVMTEAQLSAGDLENIMLTLVSEGRAKPAGDSAFTITTPACATA